MLCPRCAHELVENVGVLGEEACPQCQSRFLDEPATTTVFIETAGLSQEGLVALASGAPKTAECPSCRSKMSAIQVRSADVWLCTGCGSASLVMGALASISDGRFAEPKAIEVPRDESAVAVLSVKEVEKAELAKAFAEAKFRSPIDAAATGGHRHGLIAERATRREAEALLLALARVGIDAEAADINTARLPKVVLWRELTFDARGVTGAYSVRRDRREAFLGWDELQVAAVGIVKFANVRVERTSTRFGIGGVIARPERPMTMTKVDEAGDATLELCGATQRVRVCASSLELPRSPGVTPETAFRKHVRELLMQAPSTCLLAGDATALRVNASARLRTHRQKSWQDLLVWARWLAARAIDVEM